MNGCETSGSGSREANGQQDGLLVASPLWRQLPVMVDRARRFEPKPNDARRTPFAERQRLYREGRCSSCGHVEDEVPARAPRAGSLRQEVNAVVAQGIGG